MWNKEIRPTTQSLAAIAIILIILSVLIISDGKYIDDAYITLSYASTLAESGTWGMASHWTSNAATSPLNVIIEALIIHLGANGDDSIFILNIFSFILSYYGLSYFSIKKFGSNLFSIVVSSMVFINPLLFSTLGLESVLFISLSILFTRFLAEQRIVMFSLTATLLVLCRPDGLIFFIIGLSFLSRINVKHLLRYILIFGLTLAPWYIYSWIELGSFIPDTFFIKKRQSDWGGSSYFSGLFMYLEKFPLEFTLSFFLACYAPFISRKSISGLDLLIKIPAIYTLAHFISYSLIGVPPYHWYYSYEVFFITLIGTIALFSLNHKQTSITILTFFFAGSTAINLYAIKEKDVPPISTNWGSVQQYKEIAEWINHHTDESNIQIQGELGVIQYYTNANMVDEFSDRKILLEKKE